MAYIKISITFLARSFFGFAREFLRRHHLRRFAFWSTLIYRAPGPVRPPRPPHGALRQIIDSVIGKHHVQAESDSASNLPRSSSIPASSLRRLQDRPSSTPTSMQDLTLSRVLTSLQRVAKGGARAITDGGNKHRPCKLTCMCSCTCGYMHRTAPMTTTRFKRSDQDYTSTPCRRRKASLTRVEAIS